ncbi:ImmA/IrrE family metallo-endopeptidase [Fusobacterium gonidiaformans]|uniref:ImmA/IrrE family metallo-endopeptidase n=1 Tax=Fusobacterium gonidiaformans TaxID=849 RepID=UPI0023F4DA9C|nr:ImmA/IrrE family metallo-endopeptidase [Fusobacterium gonidiaformans]
MLSLNIKLRVKNLIERCGTRNLFKICKKLNIEVLFMDLGNIKGFYNSAVGNKFIAINEKLTEWEIKIVLAHELGHALLHCDKTTRFLLDYTKIVRTARQEKEANEFAAYLLEGILGEERIPEEELFLKREILEEIMGYLG